MNLLEMSATNLEKIANIMENNYTMAKLHQQYSQQTDQQMMSQNAELLKLCETLVKKVQEQEMMNLELKKQMEQIQQMLSKNKEFMQYIAGYNCGGYHD
jgi:regulator of sirC expression with transglutaminase-like and TPR domain